MDSRVPPTAKNSSYFLPFRFIYFHLFPSLLLSGIKWPVSCTNNELVNVFSLVNHKGWYQGWKQTSNYPLVILLNVVKTANISLTFTMHNNTSFGAYLCSMGIQHGNLHQSSLTTSRVTYFYPILFCGPTQESALTTSNPGKTWERILDKMKVNGPGR